MIEWMVFINGNTGWLTKWDTWKWDRRSKQEKQSLPL